MKNIAFMLTLLLLPYWGLAWTALSEALRGRIGVALVFSFTGIGHFIKTAEMAQMLPAWVPGRIPLIYGTGILELIAAVTILLPQTYRPTGLALCLFLLLILPSNIYAAYQRIDFGGHAEGPVYLLLRLPLQLFLIGWIWWFAVRPAGTGH